MIEVVTERHVHRPWTDGLPIDDPPNEAIPAITESEIGRGLEPSPGSNAAVPPVSAGCGTGFNGSSFPSVRTQNHPTVALADRSASASLPETFTFMPWITLSASGFVTATVPKHPEDGGDRPASIGLCLSHDRQPSLARILAPSDRHV